jgi:hypothetical protein
MKKTIPPCSVAVAGEEEEEEMISKTKKLNIEKT